MEEESDGQTVAVGFQKARKLTAIQTEKAPADSAAERRCSLFCNSCIRVLQDIYDKMD